MASREAAGGGDCQHEPPLRQAVLVALGSRLLPAIETGLIGSLDVPLSPIWVWLAFGEMPITATIMGGLIVVGAVFTHILVSAQIPAATVKRSEQHVASRGFPPNLPL